jgi:hypothetical protein
MKEKNARRDSNAASDPMERLRFKKLEANYQRKIIDAEDEFREKRKVIRAEADKYLVLIEQALKGVQQRDHVLTIKWKVVA